MKLLYLDDSKIRKENCSRETKGDIISVGGLVCDADAAFSLEIKLDELCKDAGFPEDEVFKWSPSKGHWMRKELVGDSRLEFFSACLDAAEKLGIEFIVASEDSGYKVAAGLPDHELDALALCVERFDNQLVEDERGLVFVAKPSGDSKGDKVLLDECKKLKAEGTNFSKLERVGMNFLTMPFAHSRLLQLADVVVSSTTAMVAGNETYSKAVFKKMRNRFCRNGFGNKGGIGLKIHPDLIYENLYFWILDEGFIVHEHRELPDSSKPFAENSLSRRKS